MGGVSGGGGYMNVHLLSIKGWDLNSVDVSCGNGLINRNTISQCNNSSYFK